MTTNEPVKNEAVKTRIALYRFWTYDLWGNENDGWEVNDRYDRGLVEVIQEETIYNRGSEHEFVSWECSKESLKEAVAAIVDLDWEGENEYTLYATYEGKPICELEFHELKRGE